MSVRYLPSAEGREDPSADETARELVFLAGHDARLLPEDDAYDVTAVELAANGIRPVKLTLAERLAAATRILTSGGSVHSVCLRLGLPSDTEGKWLQLHDHLSSVVSIIVALAFMIIQVVQQIVS